MPSANTIDGEDGASRSRKRAYFNKSRDHARQNHDDVEILGGEPSGTSFLVLCPSYRCSVEYSPSL